MTYGSQAAAASHVFEQQRDLALRDRSRTELQRDRGRAAEARRRDVRDVRELRQPDRAGAARGDPVGADVHRLRPQGRAVTAGTRPRDDAARPTRRGRCAARLARGHPAGSGESRGRGDADAAGAVRDRRRRDGAGPPEGRVAAADRRVQDPRRVPRDRLALGRASGRAASSPTPRATTRRASRSRRDCSGTRAVIVMPSNAPAIKRRRVEADGAEIVTVGPASDERAAMAQRLAAEQGLVLIPPYDDDRIIAGQGTLGLEIAEDVPDLAAVLIPIGGGGLSSGVAVAVRALHPSARIIGVEPELAADARDIAARGPHRALGRRCGQPDHRRRRPRRRRSVGGRSRTCRGCWTTSSPFRRPRSRAGGPARRRGVAARRRALGRARARRGALPRPRGGDRRAWPGTVVAVVSGGNVDPERYRALLESPLP